MSKQPPMATVRLQSKGLDVEVLTRLLAFPSDLVRITASEHIWFASTESFIGSNSPDDHLDFLSSKVQQYHNIIRNLYPDLVISFSVLINDPEFDIEDLNNEVILKTTQIGELAVEVSHSGEEIFYAATWKLID